MLSTGLNTNQAVCTAYGENVKRILALSAACFLSFSINADEVKQPVIYIGSGAELQISYTETAKVFGFDSCPSEFDLSFLKDEQPLNGCTSLSLKQYVA
jgi:hypothetical protein